MITLTEIFTIIIIHWVADFVFQDEKWALGKSKNWSDLLTHTGVYSCLWLFPICTGGLLGLYSIKMLWAIPVTFVFHTATDYITSREVSKKFDNNHYGSAIPNFGAFSIIGFDQLLHYIQLFLTYYYLKQL
jgi:hypothetical protein